MKLFVTSDLHGNRVLMDKLHQAAEGVDAILICGDIGGKGIRGKSFQEFSAIQKQDADYLVSVLEKIDIPAWFILGNDDWFEYSSNHYLSVTESLGGYSFVPFEFVLLTPFSTNREVNDNKIRYELEKLTVDDFSILVAHTPPLGVGDMLYSGNRCGSGSVRRWIEANQPRLWLNGHIHENSSHQFIGKTLVVNCACDYTSNELTGYCIDLESLEISRVSY